MYDLGIGNVIIVSAHNGWEPFMGAVYVKDARIGEVRCTDGGSPADRGDCAEWLDGGGKILMPGLFNGHCHGDMTLARGIGDGLTLEEQNRAYEGHNWFKAFITDEDRYYSRQLTYCEALLSGTTFICENMYWSLGDGSITAMGEIGIKGALVEDIRRDFSNQDDLVPVSELKKFMDHCLRAGLIPIAGLPSEEDFETERLLRAKENLDAINMRRTMHLAESDWRIAITRRKFNATPVDYLGGLRFFSGDFIGSHVVHVSPGEITLMKNAGAKVVNTPLCEMKIADGIAPIPEMTRRGLPVALGTDGAMWNNSNDIFREMKGMALLHSVSGGTRSLSAERILDMATINGAAAFGVLKDRGTIEPGKQADMILVETDIPAMQPLRLGARQNVTSSLVYNATGSMVTHVFVGGRQLVKDKRLQGIDTRKITAMVRKASEKIAAGLDNFAG